MTRPLVGAVDPRTLPGLTFWFRSGAIGSQYLASTTFSYTGDIAAASPIISGMSNVGGLVPGMAISHANFAANTTILTVDSATQITVSANASGTANGATLTFTGTLAPGAREHSGRSNSMVYGNARPIYSDSDKYSSYPSLYFPGNATITSLDCARSQSVAAAWVVMMHDGATFTGFDGILGDPLGVASQRVQILGGGNGTTILNATAGQSVQRIDGALNGNFALAGGLDKKMHIAYVEGNAVQTMRPGLGRFYSGTNIFKGWIYEAIATNAIPSNTARNNINQYLAAKYGITLLG